MHLPKFKVLYYLFKIESNFRVLQNFELKRVVSAPKGHQFAPLDACNANMYSHPFLYIYKHAILFL